MTEACGHCGRTSHGMACCGMLGLIEGNPCRIDHTTEHHTVDGRPFVVRTMSDLPPPEHRQHGPTPPRRPVRRIDPRGTR